MSIPVAVDDKVEPGLNVESADVKVFKRWGMVLVFPIKSPSGVIHAFLVMGEKKAGTRYFKDDIDLLNTVSTAAALTIDRIVLQEDLIREHLETERLKELNEVKSLFVSSMVHELKRPLSGIKMFTELLQFKKDDSPDSEKKYLSIIDGESEKLKRLINNILDNAMIEKGIKNYRFKRLEINSVVQKTVCDAEYLFKIKNQKIEVNLLYQKVMVDGDAEAIESMLTNLITNASKYSTENTKTTVTTFISENQIAIEIKDEGKGIAESELENIFQPYFRIKEKSSSMVDGTGLGLSIVKHIVEAHNGTIKVESAINKGTTFTIFLPLTNH
jgi:two-component system phosphate regulon sensor histidine kinase PhoR